MSTLQYLQVFSAGKKTLYPLGLIENVKFYHPREAPDPTGTSLKSDSRPGWNPDTHLFLSESRFVTQSHRTALCSSSSNTKNKSEHWWEILHFVVHLRLDVLEPINIWFLHCNLQAENFLLKHHPDEQSSVRNLPGFVPASPNCFWELIQTRD